MVGSRHRRGVFDTPLYREFAQPEQFGRLPDESPFFGSDAGSCNSILNARNTCGRQAGAITTSADNSDWRNLRNCPVRAWVAETHKRSLWQRRTGSKSSSLARISRKGLKSSGLSWQGDMARLAQFHRPADTPAAGHGWGRPEERIDGDLRRVKACHRPSLGLSIRRGLIILNAARTGSVAWH